MLLLFYGFVFKTWFLFVTLTPGTHFVGQAVLKRRSACLCLQSAGIKGVDHHVQQDGWYHFKKKRSGDTHSGTQTERTLHAVEDSPTHTHTCTQGTEKDLQWLAEGF